MTKVLIVYTTTSGNTQRMAEAIANGARSVNGAEVVLKEATETIVDDARAADALILGTPMRHRSQMYSLLTGLYGTSVLN